MSDAPAKPIRQPLSPAAKLEIAFWVLVAAAFFYIFHLHGNLTETKYCGNSLFLWMKMRWHGDMAYAAFLPFVSLWALWRKRRDLAAAPRAVAWSGLPLVAFALFLHWVGVRAQQPRVSMAALIVLLWAIPFLLYGWRFAKHLLFPVGYLFLSIPMNFLDSMTSPLRIFAAWTSATILNGFGLRIVQTGAGLSSAAGNPFALDVAPECSGLHSLLAMTALMAAYAWYSQGTILKKWFFFLCSVPVAIVANIFRIMLVVLVAAAFGQERAMGLWHDYSGYPVFIAGILMMLALDRLMNLDWTALWHRFANRIFSPGPR
jgi:exosortase